MRPEWKPIPVAPGRMNLPYRAIVNAPREDINPFKEYMSAWKDFLSFSSNSGASSSSASGKRNVSMKATGKDGKDPNKKVIALFDMDKTLTPPTSKIEADMVQTLKDLMDSGVEVGIVSGSSIDMVTEQVGQEVVDMVNYCFFQNGTHSFKDGKEFSKTSLVDYMGEDNMKRLINFALRYIADLDIPIKR